MSTEPEAAVSQVEASKSSVLEMIEAAYPNPVTLDTMCRYTGQKWSLFSWEICMWKTSISVR